LPTLTPIRTTSADYYPRRDYLPTSTKRRLNFCQNFRELTGPLEVLQ
jgi:hypothetical protein